MFTIKVSVVACKNDHRVIKLVCFLQSLQNRADSFFDRFRKGLERTRDILNADVEDLVRGRRPLKPEDLDAIEAFARRHKLRFFLGVVDGELAAEVRRAELTTVLPEVTP